MFNHGWWQLAVGGWWRLVVGGWRLAVGGGWWLVIGGWWWLAVVGGWRLVAAGGWQRLPQSLVGPEVHVSMLMHKLALFQCRLLLLVTKLWNELPFLEQKS